jgi:hypothetical protein
MGGHIVAVRDGDDRLALRDNDRRTALPIPVAAGMNRPGHLRGGRRRRRRRRLILGLILRERLALDASHRGGLRRHLVRGRSRIGRRIRIFGEPDRLGAAGRGADGNCRQGTKPQCQMCPPSRCFSPHDNTHTHTPHPRSGELNSTKVNISLSFRRRVKVIRTSRAGWRALDDLEQVIGFARASSVAASRLPASAPKSRQARSAQNI